MSATISSEASLPGAFAAARAAGRAALVPYVTCGHPAGVDPAALLAALADAGADVLELGIPFSDPLADGPTIQRSSFEAIRDGMDAAGALDALRRFRAGHDTPVVLFTYLNPVLRYGTDRFLDDAVDAGASALLLTDLPLGADAALEKRIEARLPLIRLVAPTTPPARAREIAARARGFLYYVSRTGVTGARSELAATLAAEVAPLRAAAAVPVAVGFGISTPEQAATVGALADGVVVGSALVDALSRGGVEEGVRLVRALRAALGGTAAA